MRWTTVKRSNFHFKRATIVSITTTSHPEKAMAVQEVVAISKSTTKDVIHQTRPVNMMRLTTVKRLNFHFKRVTIFSIAAIGHPERVMAVQEVVALSKSSTKDVTHQTRPVNM